MIREMSLQEIIRSQIFYIEKSPIGGQRVTKLIFPKIATTGLKMSGDMFVWVRRKKSLGRRISDTLFDG
jgi:hypothetical protein